MQEEGMANEFLLTYEWEKFDMASATQELIDTNFAADRRILQDADQEGSTGCGDVEKHLHLSADGQS